MDKFPSNNRKLTLCPFKMKPDNPHLYPSRTKFPLDNNFSHTELLYHIVMINGIATKTVLQPSMTKFLHITDHIEKETNKDGSFQIKTNMAEPNTMFSENSTVFEQPKTTTASFRRPDITVAFGRPQPINMLQTGSKSCLKSTDVALETPMVLTFVPPETNLTAVLGRPMYTAFQRPVIALDNPNAYMEFDRPITRERPIAKEVNWTRVDRVQKRVHMIPDNVKVVMGVLCGMVASAAVHPLDVVKVRLQLFPKKVSTLSMLHRILACEGTSGLYAGLSAGILRQLTYTGTRLSVYNSLHANYKDTYGTHPDFYGRMRIGIVAGLAGAFMGVPSEVALVRMIEVRRLRRSQCSPPCSPSCKKVQRTESVIPQLLRIARREGVATWWRGVMSTLVRSVFVTCAQLGVYTEIRQVFTKGDFTYTGPFLHLYTACISSMFSAFLSLPVDQVKTRCQSYQERHRHGFDILKDILKKKGVRYLWKGLIPYYVRQAMHTMITSVLLDELIDVYVGFHEAAPRK